MTDTDWLDIGDTPAPKRRRRRKAETRVEAGSKLPFEIKRARTMVKKLNGTSRMWSCDGEFVYFRPTRVIDGVKTTVANPTTLERHRRFLADGKYTYVETQDDVEVYAVNPESGFARKSFYLGEMSFADVRRAVVLAACKRDWTLYVDCLEELASRIKGSYDSGTASLIYNEVLEYIGNLIAMRGGPTDAERAAGLSNVRRRRGTGQGKLIMLPQGRAAA